MFLCHEKTTSSSVSSVTGMSAYNNYDGLAAIVIRLKSFTICL